MRARDVLLFGAEVEARLAAALTATGCQAVAPSHHARAGERCEREAHEVGNHRIAPRDGRPGAVWTDRREPTGSAS